MNERKQRHKIREIVIRESADVSNLVPQKDGTLALLTPSGRDVAHAEYHSVGYFRLSGKPKFLRSIAIPDGKSEWTNPWKGYEVLSFVDTNNRGLGDEKLYASSASVLTWEDKVRRFGKVQHVDVLVGICPATQNPERLGWTDIIRRLTDSPLIAQGDKVLVVVDSEKNKLTSINSGQEPIIEGFRLPPNFQLAYATSDTGGESWINQEMRRRDKVARQAMAAVKRDPVFMEILCASRSLYIENKFEAPPVSKRSDSV